MIEVIQVWLETDYALHPFVFSFSFLCAIVIGSRVYSSRSLLLRLQFAKGLSLIEPRSRGSLRS